MVLTEYLLSTGVRAKGAPKFTHQVALALDELRKGVWDAQSYVYLEKGVPSHTDDDEGVITDSPEFCVSLLSEAQAAALTWLRTILGKRLDCPAEDVVFETTTNWEQMT